MKEYKRILNLKLGAMLPLLIIAIFAIFIKGISEALLSYLYGFSLIILSVVTLYAYTIQRKKIFSIFKLDLFLTILIAILGIFTIVNVNTTKIDLIILVGVYFIVTALYKLSIPLYDNKATKQLKLITIINMILSIALSISIFIYPFDYLFFKTQTVGVFTIINILLDVLYIQILRKNYKSISTIKIKG